MSTSQHLFLASALSRLVITFVFGRRIPKYSDSSLFHWNLPNFSLSKNYIFSKGFNLGLRIVHFFS